MALVLPLLMIALDMFSIMHLFLAAFILYAATAELAQVRAEEGHGRGGPDDQDDIWTAPPGYHWVPRGKGQWQLAPIHVPSNPWKRRTWR